jgi:DNA-directed RNA polymerase subunit N (RpoN/RPB10)
MLYMTCPTCGFFLGQKTIEYETKKQEICSNPKLSKQQREKEISTLLKSLGLQRYCCRMRMMTYKDLVYEILPVNNNHGSTK